MPVAHTEDRRLRERDRPLITSTRRTVCSFVERRNTFTYQLWIPWNKDPSNTNSTALFKVFTLLGSISNLWVQKKEAIEKHTQAG